MSRSRTGLGRRHYRLLAGALHRAQGYLGKDDRGLEYAVECLLDALQADHPGFDRARFRRWVRLGDDGTARRYS